MKTLLHQFWQKCAHRSQSGADIRLGFEPAAVVQAKNRAISRSFQKAPDYPGLGPFPVEGQRGPHHPQQPETLLRLAQSEPARAVGGAEQARTDSGGLLDGLLSASEFAIDEPGGLEIKLRMRIGVISDLVPSGGHFTRYLRKAPDVGAALEESSGHTVASQNLKQFGRDRK